MIDDESTNWGDTDFRLESFLPHYQTESILEEELQGLVEYEVILEGLHQDNESATATLRYANGAVETVIASYIIGCDGTFSKTQELVGVEMHRAQSKLYIIVSDMKICNFLSTGRHSCLVSFTRRR